MERGLPTLCLDQLDIAKGGGKQALELHWDSWISEEDWKWIVDRGFNTVRLPVSLLPSRLTVKPTS